MPIPPIPEEILLFAALILAVLALIAVNMYVKSPTRLQVYTYNYEL